MTRAELKRAQDELSEAVTAERRMVTAPEFCRAMGTTMAEMAEAQERHEYEEQCRLRGEELVP